MKRPDFQYLYHLIELNELTTFLETLKEYLKNGIFEREITLLIAKREALQKGIRTGILDSQTWQAQEDALIRECLLFCEKVEKHDAFHKRKRNLSVFLRFALLAVVSVSVVWLVWTLSGRSFRTTFVLNGSKGVSELIVRDSGYVEIEIGADRRTEPIREGRAVFENIPHAFKGTPSKVNLRCDGYTLSHPAENYLLKDGVIYIEIEKIKIKHHIYGRVQADNGLVEQAKVLLGEIQTTTDSSGFFDIPLPESDNLLKSYRVIVLKTGYDIWDANVQANDEINIILTKSNIH